MEPSTAVSNGRNYSIIIPAYNEETGIAQTMQQLLDEKKLQEAEIIVVDDGSTDQTAEIIQRYPRVKGIRHFMNTGYGSSIVTGTRASTRDYVIWFDADGQHRVEDLLAVGAKLTGDQLEYCIGVRDNTSYQDANRKLGKWLLKQSVNFSVGRKVPDFNSGLRGFKREVLLRYLHLLPKRFGASTLTTLLMTEENHYGATVPIRVNQRLGKSTVKQVRDGFQTLNIVLHIMLLFKPLKFFGWVGLILIISGSIYGVIKALLVGLGIPVLAALVVILGLQSFFFGLLCDQISALRRERFY